MEFNLNGPGSVGDRVWLDENRNGVQDEGETGINGVRVILLDADGNELAQTVTGNDVDGNPGFYGFEGLEAQTEFPEDGELERTPYQLQFRRPGKFAFTLQNADPLPIIDGETFRDSDADRTTGKTSTFILTDLLGGFSSQSSNWDAGLIPFENRVRGTGDSDELRGTRQDDLIQGLAGRDVIRGFSGDDILEGGNGRDNLIGGRGSDLMIGGQGRDRLRGSNFSSTDQAEFDVLVGGEDEDLFILGGRNGSFYNLGGDEQALIVDLELGQDRIQLHGNFDDYDFQEDLGTVVISKNQDVIAKVQTDILFGGGVEGVLESLTFVGSDVLD